MFLNFDPTYLLCVFLPAILLSLGVRLYLSRTFNRWSQVANSSRLNGLQVADVLFQRTTLDPVQVVRVSGTLTDHYDPRDNTVRLSDPVATKPSVSSMAVSAHELGHVEQYQTGSGLIKARSFLLPAIQFSPMLSYFSFILGFMLNITGLLWLGVLFFSLMVVFSILTLPVEINASRRALRLLEEAQLFGSEEEAAGAKAVLRAAAMTYLAAAITSVLQLLYYIAVASSSRRR